MQALLRASGAPAAHCRHTQRQRHVTHGPASLLLAPRALRPVRCRRAVAAAAAKADLRPSSAKAAVEAGLEAFKSSSNYDEALRLFQAALELNPKSEEAVAALYNMGCAYAKQRQWQQAADAIGRAINEHNLKLSVALQDPDLRELRDTRQWIDMLAGTKVGMSRDAKLALRSEAKAPFRLTRIVIFGALAAGAGLGLFIILGRLAQAVRGGEGAPDLNESLTNLAINGAALAVLSFLLVRDLRARDKDAAVTAREEALSRLLVRLSGGRLLPLIRFRGVVRPVIVAGDRSFVDRAVKAAEDQKAALRERGVSIVPVVYGSDSDPEEKLRALKREWGRETGEQPRKGFGAGSSGAASPGPVAGAEAEPQAAAAASPITEQDKRWQLEAAELQEWEEWIEAQKEFAGMAKDRRNCWVQVQLDGTVRASGVGQVPWGRLVNDLPLMGSLQTTTSDGIISDV